MTHHEVNVVQVEGVAPVELLDGIELCAAYCTLCRTAVDVEGVTADRSLELNRTAVDDVVGEVGRKCEVLQEVGLKVSASVDVVGDGLVEVGACRGNRVIEPDGVDWGDGLSEEEHVGDVRALRGIEEVTVGVCIAECTADADELADVLIDFGAAAETVELRTDNVALIVQVAEREVGLRVFRTAADADGVFLTDAGFKRILCPVVSPFELGGSRIEFACGGVDELVVGHTEEGVVLEEVSDEVGSGIFAGACVSLLSNQAVTIGFVGHFVVFAGAGDDVVGGDATGVPTVLGIDVNLDLALLTALGGDHDDTVGTACTVHRVGSGILEDGERLDVVGRDGVERTNVGHTVEDDERLLVGVDGTDTADADATDRTWLVAAADYLHTCHLSFEGL